MAIGTDAASEFFGTLTDLDSTSAAVSDNTFSVVGDLASWTNSDDAPSASVVGLFTFAVAPTASSVILLYVRPLNIADTTKDADAPNADIQREFLGAFVLDNVTTEQVIAVQVALPNNKSSQEYEFYIENQGGQTISAGWSLQITPKTIGPHA